MKRFATIIFFLIFSFQAASAQSIAELNIKMLEAAKNDEADSVQFWIDKGANVNYVDDDKFSALFYAIYNREYIKRCSQLNYYSDDIKYFLHAFTLPNYYKGGYETSRILLQKGINVNYRETLTPLMLASSKGDLRICKLLIDSGASISILDEEGNDAISYARGAGFERVTSYLTNLQSYSQLPTYYEILLKMDSSINVHNFSTALEFGEFALMLANNELSSDHRDLEMIKKRLVAINEQLRKYDDAQNIQNQFTKEDLSETKEKVNGMMQYPGYYDMLSNIATFAFNDGEYLKAEILINGVIEYSAKYGVKEYEKPKFILWLSHIYFVLEEFDKSEKMLNELLLRNIENEQYKKEMHTVIYLELSQINAAIGNVKGSKQYAERAINEMNQDEKANRSIALALIGESYFNENNYEKALEYFKESLVLAEPFKDNYFSIYAGIKNDLGYYYISNRELKNAELIFEELKKEYEVKNLYNQSYSVCLENLSIIYIKQGDLLKAKYYSETAQRYKNEQNKTQSADLSFLASINYGLNNYKEADSLYQLSATWIVNSLKEKFLYLSEFDRNFYVQKKNKSIDEFQSFSFNYYPINQSIVQFAFNNELFRKGMLLNASQQVRDAINNSGDKAMIENWIKLKEIRNRINFLESQPQKEQSDMMYLEEEANKLDKILTQKSKIYRQAEYDQQIQWQDVQSKLADGEATIEFSSFRFFHKDWTDSTMYCALILKKGMEYPVMVPLFEQKQLDSLIAGGNAMPNSLYATRGVTAYYEDQLPNGQKLYNLIWKPLEKELQDVKTVYYSPSGSLHQISFAALPTDTAHYLCDKYNLVQLSSTRQLATSAWQSKTEQISSTALFGGIKYNLDKQEIAEMQRTLSKNDLAISSGFTQDSNVRFSSFDSLPGTRKEVEAISTTLHSHQIKTSLYSGINGNEEAFKALSNQNIGVLHIATHGFFYPDEKEKPQDLDRMMLMGEQKFRYVPNPLRRSGLILAGGNRTWNGEEPVAGMEDGILTAQEISEMNLQNTELVVLSACETGLGDIKGGEGVFGLQRAFKLAGAKTIIMSLWKVDDGATKELMQSFYEKWLGGMDKHEAFRLAQKELKKKEKYKAPYYWAGFVIVD